MMRPPTTAPGTLSRPPRITAGKTLRPTRASWVSTPSMLPQRTPPRAAASPAMAHEIAKTTWTLMPTAIAACWSLATARMAIPRRLFRKNQAKPTRKTPETTAATTLMGEMEISQITYGSRRTGSEMFLVWAPQTIAADPWKTWASPMVTRTTEMTVCPAGRPDGELGLHGRLTAVLVGDDRVHRYRRPVREECVDDLGVLLGHEAAPHLPRARDLLVVGVELLVEQDELADARALRQVAVHPLHLLPDEVAGLGLLGEVRVGGIGDLAPLRQLPDVLHLDVDHGRHVGPVLTHRHGLLDVRADLDLLLHLLGRELGAVGEGRDVLGAIDDDQVTVRIEHGRVPRVEPALADCRGGRLRAPLVGREHARAPADDLTRLGEADLGVGKRLAHGAAPDVARPPGAGPPPPPPPARHP